MPDEGFRPTRPSRPGGDEERFLTAELVTPTRRPAPSHTDALPLEDDGDSDDRSVSDDRMLAVLCHVGGFFTSFVLPLLLWLSNKGRSPLVEQHGKESLNLQIFECVLAVVEMIVAVVVFVVRLSGGMSSFAAWGWVIAGGVVVALMTLYELVFIPIASFAAWKGRPFRYPCIIRFIR